MSNDFAFEYEEDKKPKSKKKIVLTIVIIVLILLGIGSYFIVNKKDNDKSKTNVNTNKILGKEPLSTDSAQVVNLFKSAHSSHGFRAEDAIYKTDGMTVEEMTLEYKFGIASNSLESSGKIIKEEDIKNAYEKVFGPNTYKAVSSFILGCAPYTYNDNDKTYTTTDDGCGYPATLYDINEEIIFSYKYDDRIEIISAIVYTNKEDASLYKDYSAYQKIEEYDVNTFNAKSYLTENYTKLTNYTYTFDLNKDGFYYLSSIKKTN